LKKKYQLRQEQKPQTRKRKGEGPKKRKLSWGRAHWKNRGQGEGLGGADRVKKRKHLPNQWKKAKQLKKTVLTDPRPVQKEKRARTLKKGADSGRGGRKRVSPWTTSKQEPGVKGKFWKERPNRIHEKKKSRRRGLKKPQRLHRGGT